MVSKMALAMFVAVTTLPSLAFAMPDGGYRDSVKREFFQRCEYGDRRACYKFREMKQNERRRDYYRAERRERDYGYGPRY